MRLDRAITLLARGLALIGGVALIAVTVLTVVSIAGRALVGIGLGPVPGDFELVQAFVGFAVFAFLPWCQLKRGHATVDIFTSFLPDGVNRVIDLVTELLMTVTVTLIAWRLFVGMTDKMRYGETTFILQFPLWWPYAAGVAATCCGVIVSFYVLWRRIRDVAAGRPFDPAGHGSGI